MGTYLWARRYQDDSDSSLHLPKKVFALALTADEKGLVAAGEVHGGSPYDKYVFIHWLSTTNGAQIYKALHVETSFKWNIYSSQMLSFGCQGYIYLLLDDEWSKGDATKDTTLIVVEQSGTSLLLKKQYELNGRYTSMVYNSASGGNVVLGGGVAESQDT